ncbi:uncharacterized protein [Rutidosis leptorrhynchoides]|uniref:uncharacterized protein n=1 Tax=Rutidosis leptorrhynchoides TaxID=125765 RepID=UPI003A9A5631
MDPSSWEFSLDIDDSDLFPPRCNLSQLQCETQTSPSLHNIPGATGLLQASRVDNIRDKAVEHQNDPSSWELSLDIDDSDLFQPRCNLSQLQCETQTSPPLHNIPGPAGIIQASRLAKLRGKEVEHQRDTQDYIRVVAENPEQDDHFKHRLWLSAMEFAYPLGGQSILGNIKVVGVIISCVPTDLGELKVVLKDRTGTCSGNIHHKLLPDVKGLCVGSVLVLHKVSVFQPPHSSPSLNITKKNLVKVFYKDSGSSRAK